jgi:hypothetical protein
MHAKPGETVSTDDGSTRERLGAGFSHQAASRLTFTWSRSVSAQFRFNPTPGHPACGSTTRAASFWKEDKVADDRTITGPADRLRINLNEDYEVRYWTQKWRISPEELAEAVREAGVMVKDVARKLGKEV